MEQKQCLGYMQRVQTGSLCELVCSPSTSFPLSSYLWLASCCQFCWQVASSKIATSLGETLRGFMLTQSIKAYQQCLWLHCECRSTQQGKHTSPNIPCKEATFCNGSTCYRNPCSVKAFWEHDGQKRNTWAACNLSSKTALNWLAALSTTASLLAACCATLPAFEGAEGPSVLHLKPANDNTC